MSFKERRGSRSKLRKTLRGVEALESRDMLAAHPFFGAFAQAAHFAPQFNQFADPAAFGAQVAAQHHFFDGDHRDEHAWYDGPTRMRRHERPGPGHSNGNYDDQCRTVGPDRIECFATAAASTTTASTTIDAAIHRNDQCRVSAPASSDCRRTPRRRPSQGQREENQSRRSGTEMEGEIQQSHRKSFQLTIQPDFKDRGVGNHAAIRLFPFGGGPKVLETKEQCREIHRRSPSQPQSSSKGMNPTATKHRVR